MIVPPRRRIVGLVLGWSLLAAVTVVMAPAASADAIRSQQWYLSPLGIEKAWSITKGKGVKIGILDSGVDGTAPDLRGAVVGGKDFSGQGSSNGQKPIGVNGSHGTSVAAFAAGRGHGSGAGVIGSAPAASLVSASVNFDNGGNQYAAGVRWLVDQGVGVINLSLSVGAVPSTVSSMRAAIGYAQSKDVVVVAATGDVSKGANSLESPADVPGVVAVTGIDKNLKRDPGATIGKGTAIAAPFSTDPTDPFGDSGGQKLPAAEPVGSVDYPYSQNVGTSFSAPIVAGVVALIRTKHPDMDAANVINTLLKTATPAGGAVPNNTYGYGIVNADKAITTTVPAVSANPLGSVAPAAPSSGSASKATSSGGSFAVTDPATSTPPGRSSTPAPSSSPAAASSSSGLGTGAVVGIIAAVVVLLALIIWLVIRGRRPAAHGGPPPPPPGGPPPPGYGPPPR